MSVQFGPFVSVSDTGLPKIIDLEGVSLVQNQPFNEDLYPLLALRRNPWTTLPTTLASMSLQNGDHLDDNFIILWFYWTLFSSEISRAVNPLVQGFINNCLGPFYPFITQLLLFYLPRLLLPLLPLLFLLFPCPLLFFYFHHFHLHFYFITSSIPFLILFKSSLYIVVLFYSFINLFDI